MVNFRNFDGVDDVITFSLGSLSSFTSGTIAVLCRRTDNTAWNGPFCTRTSGGTPEMYLDIAPSNSAPNNSLWCNFAVNQNGGTTVTLTAVESWAWVVVTKASGSATPRYHKYVMSSATWTRVNGSGNIGNAVSPSGGDLQIGDAGGDFFKGDIAAVACWTTALSDGTLNGIVNNWTSGVLAASPQGAWLLNQASTATSITDGTAGGANQTARTGTTVSSGTISNWAETNPNATPTPTTVAGLSSVQTATPKTSVTVGAVAVAAITVVASLSLLTNSTLAQTSVTAVSAVQSASFSSNSSPAPLMVAGISAVPTVALATDYTVGLSPIAASGSVEAMSFVEGTNPAPGAVETAASVPAPLLSTGLVLSQTMAVGAVSVPAISFSADSVPVASVVSGISAVQTVALATDFSVAPLMVAGISEIPDPGLQTGSDSLVSASLINVPASIGSLAVNTDTLVSPSFVGSSGYVYEVELGDGDPVAFVLEDSAHIGFADGNAGHTFTLPSTPTAGNLLVLFVHSDTTVSTPSGWTLPTDGSFVGQMGAYGFYKIAVGNETAISITTNGNFSAAASYLEYSGNVPAPFEIAVNGSTAAANTITTTSVNITPDAADSLIVAAGFGHNGDTAFTSATWTGGLTNVIVGDFQTSLQHAVGHRLESPASLAAVSAIYDPSNRTFTNVGTIAMAFEVAADPNATASASTVVAVASVQSPTVSAQASATVTPITVAAVAAQPAVVISNQSLVDALFVQEDTSTSFFTDGGGGHAITLPSTPTASNLLLLCVNSDTTVSTPSGWTLPTNGSFVVQQGAYIFYKMAAGNETAVTVTTSGNFGTLVTYFEYSGNLAVSPFDKAANAQQDHGGYISTPSVSVTPITTGELLLAFGALAGNTGSAASSPVWTDSYTNRISTTLNGSVGFQQFIADIRGASVAAHAASVSWSTSPVNVDFSTTGTIVVAFKPAQVLGQNATTTVSTVAGTASVQTAGLSTGAGPAPASVTTVASVQSPTVSVPAVNATVSASTVVGVGTIPSFSASVSVAVDVLQVAGISTVQMPGLTASSSVTISASPVQASSTVWSPNVVVPVSAVFSASTVAISVTMVDPVVSALTIFRDLSWVFGKAVQ